MPRKPATERLTAPRQAIGHRRRSLDVIAAIHKRNGEENALKHGTLPPRDETMALQWNVDCQKYGSDSRTA